MVETTFLSLRVSHTAHCEKQETEFAVILMRSVLRLISTVGSKLLLPSDIFSHLEKEEEKSTSPGKISLKHAIRVLRDTIESILVIVRVRLRYIHC